MQAQLCFFNDFDSFQVEPNYLELVYQTESFRFVHPNDLDLRKFSLETLGNIQVTLPGMLLQYETDGIWSGLYIVDLCARFIDPMKFADFVSKLGNIAGYQQLIVPTVGSSDALAEMQSNSEDDGDGSFEDFESDGLDENIAEMNQNRRPLFSLFEDYTVRHVTGRGMALTVGGVVYRFSHPRLNRQFHTGSIQSNRAPRGRRQTLEVYGVTFQAQGRGARRYVVDLYMEFVNAESQFQLAQDLGRVAYGAI